MKIAFVADVHLGNHRRHGGSIDAGLNERCRHVLSALKRAIDTAVKLGCSKFFVLGDLFDSVRPEPQLIAATQKVLDKRISVVLLLGNHDQVSTEEGDHALGPLAALTNVAVIDSPDLMPWGAVEGVLVPFRPGDAREWLPSILDTLFEGQKQRGHRMLALHLGIEDDQTPAFLRGAHDAVPVTLLKKLCEQHKIGTVFAGNWHTHRQWTYRGSLITQVGTLAPTGWDNPGTVGYGNLVVLEDAGLEQVECIEISGPRFVDVRTRADVRALDPLIARGHQLYVRDFGGVLDDAAKGLLAGFETCDDTTDTKAAAGAAAEAARSANTLEDAVAKYVSEMPLADGVDRAAVLERVKGYLAQ